MKKRRVIVAILSQAAAAAVSSVASAAAPAFPLYDGFNYSATGSPFLGTGPSSATGAYGQWIYQGNNSIEPRVTSGSLSYTGLPPSVGNKVTLDNGSGPPPVSTGADASRLYFGTASKADVPTLYYSFVTSIPSSTNNNQNGAFFAGFDNLTAGTSYTTFGGLFVRQDAGDTTKIDLGISTSGSANKVWSAALPHDTPLFVAVSFNFQGLANLDVFTDPTAVPLTEPGTHTATSSGVDASASTSVTNFYLRGNSGEPQGIMVDEVRIGSAWQDVAAHGYYWDIDQANPGSGGATPSGNWDGTTQNFNSDPAGGGSGFLTATMTRGDTVLFSAASDATGSYTVTVSGTQTAGTVSFKNGNVTLGGTGTLAVGRFDAPSGTNATVSALVSGAQTGGSVTKVGDGNVTFSAANTYAGGTLISAGAVGLGIDSVGVGAGVTSGPLGTGVVTLPSNGSLFAAGAPRTLGNNIVITGSPIIITGTNDLNLAGDVSLGGGNRGLRIDNGTTSFSGVISGSGGIVKTGTGAAILSGANTYSGATSIFAGTLSVSSSNNLGDGSATNTLLFNGGTLRATGPVDSAGRNAQLLVSSTVQADAPVALGDVSGTASLTKTGTGALTVNSLRTTANLTVSTGALAIAPNGTATGVSVVNTVTTTPAGRLDIGDNHLIVHANPVGTANAGVYDGISGLIQSGRAGGAWNGSGIVTSQSTAAAGSLTTIGVSSAQDVKGLANPADTSTWTGQTVTGSDTLVMYTYGGDANLDGKINVDDYGRIDLNSPIPGASGWSNGDFNYDGKINVDDYGIIDFNVGIQGTPFFTASAGGPAGVAAVPEPAAAAATLLLSAGALTSRRRRH